MFNKRTHCALVLMIELAHVYGKQGVEISGIAVKHNLPVHAFDGIAEVLNMSGYIIQQDGQLSLQISPDKISIWDIVESTDKDRIGGKEAIESQTDKQLPRTSTTIMVDQELEIISKTVRFRLQRYKLSTWSEKASKMIYI